MKTEKNKTPVPENNTSKGQKKKESFFEQLPTNFNMKPFSTWRREWRAFSMFMACVVVFVTTYSLILPAISMEIDEAQEMEGVYLDDGDFSVEEAEPGDGDSPEWAEIDYETSADGSSFTDDVITSVDRYDLAEDIEGAADALTMVSTLEASAAGVDVKLTYPEDVSADTEMIVEAIDRDDPEESYDSYYYGAADEISRAYPDWSVFDAGFWHAESAAGSDIDLEMNFRPAVYDEGVSVFDADGPLVYEDGRLVYVIGGLEKGIETGKVVFVDWTDMWHLYENEDVHIETFDNGIVRISVETDALMDGAAVFGVVVLEEKAEEDVVDPEQPEETTEPVAVVETEEPAGETVVTEAESEAGTETEAALEPETDTEEITEEESTEAITEESAEAATEESEESDTEVVAEENTESVTVAETEAETKTEIEAETEVEAETKDESETEVEPETETETEELTEAVSETLPAEAGDYTIQVPGEDYVLHVSYGEDAGIPADPEIVAVPVEDEEYAAQAIEEVKSVVEENASTTENASVTDVTENIEVAEDSAHNDGSDDAENFENEDGWTERDRLKETEDLTEIEQDTTTTSINTTDQLKLVGLFDLTIYHDGNVIQPQAPITVSVEFKSGLAENEQIYAVHFPGTGEQPEEQPTKETSKPEETTQQFENSANKLDAESTDFSAEDSTALGLISYVDTEEEQIIGEDQTVEQITMQSDQAEIVEPEATTPETFESESTPEPVDTTPEVIVAETADDIAVFTTDSLSYIAIVSYTVDFHWNVDGQEFSFSIPGGGYTTLSYIVRILGIAGKSAEEEESSQPSEEDIRKFIDDVANVEFSSPELLSVSKVEESTTIGAIKEHFGLECEYSAELTAEEIEEINESGIEAVDWALISLKAFTSEESLTVTMKDGESFEIRVTDATYNYKAFFNEPNYGYFTSGANDLFAKYSNGSGYQHVQDVKVSEDNRIYEFTVPLGGKGYSATANSTSGGHFVTWLKVQPDGTIVRIDDQTLADSNRGEVVDTTFVAYLAQDGKYLIAMLPYTGSMGTVTRGKWVDNAGTLPTYYYSTDTVEINNETRDAYFRATPATGYYFKGWYNSDGELISTAKDFSVSSATKDLVLHAEFGIRPRFSLATNIVQIDNQYYYPGYFMCQENRAFTGSKSTFTGDGYDEANKGAVYLLYDYYAYRYEGYDFAFWLKDDGLTPAVTGEDKSTLHGFRVYLDRDTTYIAWFAPSGQHIVRVNSAEPSAVGTTTSANPFMWPRSVTTSTNSKEFLYYFSNDVTSINARSVTGYTFLGWYNNYDPVTETGTLITTDQTYLFSEVTTNLNLTPVYEPTVENRNYYNVWFDGTNGINGKDWTTRNNTLYSRINGDGIVEGAQSVRQEVLKTENNIELPTTAARPQGSAYTGFTLQGWYDVYNGDYYLPGASATITADSVFYADWFPVSYDIGQAVNVFTPTERIKYPDTSSFITTSMYDYNSLFNMPSINLLLDEYVGEYEDSAGVKQTYTRQTHINKLGNYEYWQIAGPSTRDFLFISAVSGDVRTLSPIDRKNEDYNQNRETSRDGGFYTGDISAGILDKSGLRDALFAKDNPLGKRYVGDANYLYLYDTETGYYYYDSDKNAASFNKSAGRFYVYDYVNCTDKSISQGGTDYADFLPFNSGKGDVHDVKAGETTIRQECFRESYGEPNYWFGMKSSIDFFLPNASDFIDGNKQTGNRSIIGDEMVFKFCGDDDVWVYVDDQLFLDLGGIHGKVYGEINFSRGTCTTASSGAKKIIDERGIMSYDASESDPLGGHDGLVNTTSFYLSEGDHTVTIYYLERGSSQSNCAIYFNLAPRYKLNLLKVDNEDSTRSLSGAVFGIYSDAACTLAANVWETATGTKTNIFTTDSLGYIDVSGLIAGHDYYLKELVAPPGYPDISEEVITLSLGSLGQASVSSTADATENGVTWKLADVSSSEEVGSTNKGTFTLSMTVKNRHQVSITAQKIWAMYDGSMVQRDTHASVTVKLQRKMRSEEPDTQNSTVRIITRYFADSNNKPTNTDTGSTILTYDVESHQVEKGGSISFTVTTGNNASIYSVASQYGGITTISLSDYSTVKFFENGGYTTGPRNGRYTLSGIQRNTDIYVTCIGTADKADSLGISISNVTTAQADGSVYKLVDDTTFNNGTLATNNQPLEVTLSSSNNWKTTWSELESGSGANTYYYYVKETAYHSTLSDAPLVSSIPAYVDTYSSDGLSGGTITVRNILNAQKVKIRKRDSADGSNVANAEFKIYTQGEYEAAGFTASQQSAIETNASIWLEETNNYNSERNVFVSDALGRFYTGFLPLGTYYLIETGAPAGYKTLDGPVQVEITGNGMNYKIPGESSWHSRKVDNEGYYNLYIDNIPLTDIQILKEDNGHNPLAGAIFQLAVMINGAENLVLSSNDPDYSRIEGLGNVTVTTSSGNTTTFGSAFQTTTSVKTLQHLPDGTYHLKEVAAPAGYINTIGSIEFTVTNRVVSLVSPTETDKVTFAPATSGATPTLALFTVENEPGVALPSTGGPGIKYLYLLGTLLTTLATIGLLLKRRQ